MAEDFQPPPGPPPGHAQQPNAPAHWQSNNPFIAQLQQPPDYMPPPGPPPGHQQQQQQAPPAYEHPWRTQVEDTSLLPPPPGLGNEVSPTSNAPEVSAQRAEIWCHQNPLTPPQYLSEWQREQVQKGDLAILAPPGFSGTIGTSGQDVTNIQAKAGKEKSKSGGLFGKIKNRLDKERSDQPSMHASGAIRISSRSNCTDTVLLSSLPLYAAQFDSPLYSQQPRTIYFELRVLRLGEPSSRKREEAESGIAIGFLAPPYPSWRLPGWERASLAVHGDDGRRYINDGYGGIDFTTAFKEGEVVGIGLTLRPSPSGRCEGDVFFTREGRRDGGWSLQEQMDERQSGGVDGLTGERDLYAAVGLFGPVEVEARFRRQEWLFRP